MDELAELRQAPVAKHSPLAEGNFFKAGPASRKHDDSTMTELVTHDVPIDYSDAPKQVLNYADLAEFQTPEGLEAIDFDGVPQSPAIGQIPDLPEQYDAMDEIYKITDLEGTF